MFVQSVTNEEVNKLEKLTFEGEIVVIETSPEAEKAAEEMKNHTILGFDTENRPQFKKGSERKTALLQISTSSKAYLIRIDKIGLPKEIINILENKDIKKIGLGILEDIRALQKIKKFAPKNFIDLQKLTTEHGIKDNGLRKIAAIVLGGKVSKSQQLSNWNNSTYTESQKTYAATDAWICYKIYEKITENHEKTNYIETQTG